MKKNLQQPAIPLAPHTILGWTICTLGAIFYSYEYLLRITPSVMSAQLMQHFHINATMFGTMSAMYNYAYVPMQLPVGILMDRFGPRRLLTFACAMCVIGTYFFAASHSLLLAALGRFLVGFGSAFAFVGVLKLATIWLPANRFAMFAGLSSALGTIGAMTGVVLLTRLVSQIGYHDAVYFSAIVGVILMVILWLVIRDDNPKVARELADLQNQDSIKKLLQELRLILRNPQMWLIGLVGCFIYLPTTVFAELWGVPYLEHARHLSPEKAAYANSLLFMGFTVGAPLMGWVSDVLHTRKRLLFVSALVAAGLAFLLIYAEHLQLWQIYTLLFALGVSYSSQAIVFAVGRELSPASASGTAIAVTNMIVMLGTIIFQPIVGVLLDFVWDGTVIADLPIYSSADYQFALTVLPVGILFSAVLCLFLKESYSNIHASHK